ncbi:hypothetical protein E1091_02350 [Micromonospora fluostatini]|uniref:Uncharacterized protein n=1 Tax=Micromonospora fluostatini TaxID=1629071 RepID=A0ABY2DKZ2_9ACTN|nr:hypothetical protein E1091_02350 [Micromonospora fluostatini]
MHDPSERSKLAYINSIGRIIVPGPVEPSPVARPDVEFMVGGEIYDADYETARVRCAEALLEWYPDMADVESWQQRRGQSGAEWLLKLQERFGHSRRIYRL